VIEPALADLSADSPWRESLQATAAALAGVPSTQSAQCGSYALQ
jgi:hypothetical protein